MKIANLFKQALSAVAFVLATLAAASFAVPIAWTTAPSFPSPSADAAARRASDGALFLINGTNGNVTSDVVRLSPGATAWVKAPRLDQERTGMGVGLLPGGNIVVFGGLNKSTHLTSGDRLRYLLPRFSCGRQCGERTAGSGPTVVKGQYFALN